MFYDKYVELCRQKGVSLSAAAIAAGISKSLITKWKNNATQVPSPEVLQKLSVYFNVSIAELLEKEKPTIVSDDELSDSKRDMINLLLSLSPEEFEKKEAAIRAILNL